MKVKYILLGVVFLACLVSIGVVFAKDLTQCEGHAAFPECTDTSYSCLRHADRATRTECIIGAKVCQGDKVLQMVNPGLIGADQCSGGKCYSDCLDAFEPCGYTIDTCDANLGCLSGKCCECKEAGQDGCDGTTYVICKSDGCNWEPQPDTPGKCGECAENQTIMRLSQSYNAKGAIWDNEAYDFAVCFPTIFGDNYTFEEGTYPHACDGFNEVISLNQTFGGWGAVKGASDYNAKVCYGDLYCVNVSDPDNCPEGYETVLRLASDTNSLLSTMADAPIVPSEAGPTEGITATATSTHGDSSPNNAIDNQRDTAWYPTGREAYLNLVYDVEKAVSGYEIACGLNYASGSNYWTTDRIAETSILEITLEDKDQNQVDTYLYAGCKKGSNASKTFSTPVNVKKIIIRAEGVPTGVKTLPSINEIDIAASDVGGGSEVSADFPIKICCSLQPELTGGLAWRDMNNRRNITSADFGDTVRLDLLGSRDLIGRELNYTIYKKDAGFLWFDEKVAENNAKEFATWRIDDTGQFYFKVTIGPRVLDSRDFVHGLLRVSNNIIDNSPPHTQIALPVAESSYVINSADEFTDLIDFQHISSDEDDDLNLVWDFGDGVSQTFNNILTENSGNTSYQYNETGSKIISATVSEVERNEVQSDLDKSRLYVFKTGLNIFAIIDSPDYNQKETLPAETYNLDGSSSYVSKCFADQATCDTEKGSPCEAKGLPGGFQLYCYDLKDSSKLDFEWKVYFEDGSLFFEELTDDSILKRVFLNSSTYKIKLKVTDTENSISDESVVFMDIRGGIKCSSDGSEWLDYVISPPISIPTIGPESNCRINNSIGDNKICCPDDKNYECQKTDPDQWDSGGRSVYQCVITEEEYCSDFDNEDDCEDADQGIAKATAEENDLFCGRANFTVTDTKSCYDEVSCTCEWDDDDGCVGEEDVKNRCTNQPTPISHQGTCTTVITPDRSEWDAICSQQGYVEITARGTWSGGDPNAPVPSEKIACETPDTTIMPCEDVVKLPFFGMFNFALALIGIVFIYSLLNLRKKGILIINKNIK